MTRIIISRAIAGDAADLAEAVIRRRPDIVGDPGAETVELVWELDLTPEQIEVGQRILRLLRSAVRVTPAEWQALEPVLVSIRTHRTRTNAEWASMTAAQRDTALIDWNRNLTDLLRALLRD